MNNFLQEKRNVLANDQTVFLRIKVITNAPKTQFTELLIMDDEPTLKLKVAAIPEKNRANKVIEKFLSSFFSGKATIVGGQKSNLKLIQIKTKPSV